MEFEFSGPVWFWKGPAPHHFVTVPPEDCARIKAVSGVVSYGWGMIPVTVTIGRTSWATSLWPKEGSYIVPLKLAVRRSERVNEGDSVSVKLTVVT